MKTCCWLLLLIGLCGWHPAAAEPPLSAESRRVQAAYVSLLLIPDSPRAQLQYLEAFPKSGAAFLRVFMDAEVFGQLYSDSYDYIEALEKLGSSYPAEVVRICLTIEKTLLRDADAVSFLNHITIVLGIAHPNVFAVETKRLSSAEQIALCRFMADEEAIKWDKEYAQLTQLLRQVEAVAFAAKMDQAKARRVKLPNH